MPNEKVGYRRLYDSMGCSIVNNQLFHLVFPLGQHLQVEVYMGAKPKFGILIEKDHDDYLIPGSKASIGQYSYHLDATESLYLRSFFTEIACLRELEVTADLSEAFHRNDPQASNELLQLVAKDEDEYRVVADLISGIIGLRFHPQFVMKLLNENFIALRETDHAITLPSSPIQTLEGIQLNTPGIDHMSHLFPAISSITDKQIRSTGKILGWLMRAWAEKDDVSKFNALFIPIEMILEGIKGEMPQDQREQIERLENLIDTYCGEDKEKEVLKGLLARLVKSQRPSLIDRFNIFAEQAKLPGWKNDIKAFKKFNGIRNSLLHRGDPNVRTHVTVGENEIHALEDLTERYVNFALFRDSAVYQSYWQPRPRMSSEVSNNEG